MAIPTNVVPSGLPMSRRRAEPRDSWILKSENDGDVRAGKTVGLSMILDELRRKSWVTAIPMDAKANDVLSHARNVRSARDISNLIRQ